MAKKCKVVKCKEWADFNCNGYCVICYAGVINAYTHSDERLEVENDIKLQ